MMKSKPWSLLLFLSFTANELVYYCECLAVMSASASVAGGEVRRDDESFFFIAGLGYCGSRLASRLREEFPSCQIAGCVRSKDRKARIKNNNNIRVHVLDLDDEYNGLEESGIEDLSQATHLIQTVAPIADFDRDPLLALHQSVLEESNNLHWVGYLSSTGVYGDHGGEWVDEESELRCQDPKSLARVKAERDWRLLETVRRQRQQQLRVDCFRCGGIYGPGRGPLFSSSLSSLPDPVDEVPGDQEAAAGGALEAPKYVNRILVDDICGAIVAGVKASLDSKGKIFNLVDDDPAPRRDVMAEARRLVVGDSSSSVETTTTTTTGRRSRRRQASRNTGNKRCRNQLLKDVYDWQPIAPSYREGLAYLIKQTEASQG